jgi:hypothetical protein
MIISDELRERRHGELAECFAVIDTCLATYYGGAEHMYRPLAGQLRILLCDKPPLLSRVFPDLAIGALRPIEWLEPDQAVLFDDNPARLGIQHPPDQEFRLARMPFLITSYDNGLQVADLEIDHGAQRLVLDEWMNQQITLYPAELSVRDTIRSIADKGGGAHVDDTVNPALHHMYRTGPAGVGVHVLFSVAVGRLAQKIGLHYAQFVERFGYHGRLEDVVFDAEHATVRSSAQVPAKLEAGPRRQFTLTVMKRTR